MLTGVFGLESLSLYITEKRFSSIEGNTSSANTFAHELANAFCSLFVSVTMLSVIDICWLVFSLNDMAAPSFDWYYHYTKYCF
jgi:hypothetical protein